MIFYFLDTGYPAPVATLPAALSERLAEPIQLKEVLFLDTVIICIVIYPIYYALANIDCWTGSGGRPQGRLW